MSPDPILCMFWIATSYHLLDSKPLDKIPSWYLHAFQGKRLRAGQTVSSLTDTAVCLFRFSHTECMSTITHSHPLAPAPRTIAAPFPSPLRLPWTSKEFKKSELELWDGIREQTFVRSGSIRR